MTDRDLSLTHTQYIELLERQLKRIEDGVELDADDSNDHGNKYNTCSWGLCSDELEVWPEDTWLFEPLTKIRYTAAGELRDAARPKYLGEGQFCPFDRKDNGQVKLLGSGGCFFRCRIFRPAWVGKGEPGFKRPKRGQKALTEPIPTREQAIELYQIRLKEARKP